MPPWHNDMTPWNFSSIFAQDIFPIKKYQFFALNDHLFHQFFTSFWSYLHLLCLAPYAMALLAQWLALAAGASRAMVDYVHLLGQLFLFLVIITGLSLSINGIISWFSAFQSWQHQCSCTLMYDNKKRRQNTHLKKTDWCCALYIMLLSKQMCQ